MIGDKRVLAVIPARAGSRRLPHKNTLPLAGKPLIQWTIEAALACKEIDIIGFSSDDRELNLSVWRWYVNTYPNEDRYFDVHRPAELATDAATLGPVCLDALVQLEYVIGLDEPGGWHHLIVLLQPTSPLRGPEWITRALKRLAVGDVDSVQSVRALAPNPDWVLGISEDRVGAYFGPALYYPNGAVYATTRDVVLSGRVLGDRIAPLVMPERESIDIDTAEDFARAEALLADHTI